MAYHVPQTVLESLDRYVSNHIECGGFLTAVLANDLYMACARADANNRAEMLATAHGIVKAHNATEGSGV